MRLPPPRSEIASHGSDLGDREIEARAGQILVCPPNTPHKFKNLGPGRIETIDIHASETFITEWLE